MSKKMKVIIKKEISWRLYDQIFIDLLKYSKILLNNISVIILTASLIGASIQIIFLSSLSINLIVFYSAKQGLIEGGLFLLFVIITTAFYFWFISVAIFSAKITLRYKIKLVIYESILVFLFFFGKIYLTMVLFIPLVACTLFLMRAFSRSGDGETITAVETENEEKHEWEILTEKSREIRKNMMVFGSYFLFLYLISILFLKDNQKSFYALENVSTFKKEIQIKEKQKYEFQYYNSDYIFLKNLDKQTYLVFKMDDVLDKN